MPVTVSYDLSATDTNDRTYIRSMFERFGWRRLGGSVFCYEGMKLEDGNLYEEWLNHIVPALMFMRSYIVQRNNLDLSFFTVSATGSSYIDFDDSGDQYGVQPVNGDNIQLQELSNNQSSVQNIRSFVDGVCEATS
jgi:hypothetical protein